MYRKSLYLFLFLLLSARFSTVNAQRNYRHDQSRKAERSYKNVLTGHIQMNAIGRFFGGNAGLDYERFLDPQGYISADVSVSYGAVNDHFFDSSPANYTDANPFYATPGIRIHLFGNARRADLSIGSQIGVGNVATRSVQGNYQGGPRTTTTSDLTMLTYIAEANVNFQPEGRTIFGLHLAIGQHLASSDFGTSFFEFGLRVGSRF